MALTTSGTAFWREDARPAGGLVARYQSLGVGLPMP
jgi:hypothetical protein